MTRAAKKPISAPARVRGVIVRSAVRSGKAKQTEPAKLEFPNVTL